MAFAIAKNTIELFLNLPERSFYKKYLIAQLAKDIDSLEFSNLIGVTP
jgi:hypothetical protein